MLSTQSFLERDGNRYIIHNPSDPLENFADKWPNHPERKDAFYEWLNQARQDFGNLTHQIEKRRLVESVRPHMGAVADRAATRLSPTPQPAVGVAALGGGCSEHYRMLKMKNKSLLNQWFADVSKSGLIDLQRVAAGMEADATAIHEAISGRCTVGLGSSYCGGE